MSLKPSLFAPAHFPQLPPVAGLALATVASGIRYQGRPDLLLVHCVPGTVAAGVLTRSTTAAAPVAWCRRQLAHGRARAVVINAGNANAFTGKAGQALVTTTASSVAKALKAKPTEVLLASTGVIGQPLPVDSLARHVPALTTGLGQADWASAAAAIRTTDTFSKGAMRQIKIGKHTITLVGIAKGSGMIAPDMATLIGLVATDAAIAPALLRQLTRQAADASFNCITVDGDTSTNDTLLVLATGQSAAPKLTTATRAATAKFAAALTSLCQELAQLIVKDGEGAQKFITIKVSGAASHAAARQIALTIGNSPLVKTAIAGEDANWGRIVAAIGRSGAAANRDKLTIRIGGTLICRGGMQVPHYDETPVVAHMRGQFIEIAVDVGIKRGTRAGQATIWTCDLTHGYIDINGSYRS